MTAHSQPLTPHAANGTAIAVTDESSFTELVYAHYDWWHNRHNGKTTDSDGAYRDLLHRSEQHHGRIVDSFWCTKLESARALTEHTSRFPLRPVRSFHRESDWATKQSPLIATEQALARAERYDQEAANGQAGIACFAGTAAVALAVVLSAGLFLRVEWKVGVAALVAGAAGAVVSVIQRINARSFHVNYDAGRPYAFFLGGPRPLIGGAFAIAVAFAFASGMPHLPIAGDNKEHEHLALVVLSFLAGFSERFAQDALASVLPQAQQESLAPSTPSP
jgi:hypothetical protein